MFFSFFVILWKSRGAGRYKGRDAGVSAPLGDNTGSSLLILIIGVELWEARGDRKGGGVRAWGWGEAHRVRFTPALLLCSLLNLHLGNVQGTFS